MDASRGELVQLINTKVGSEECLIGLDKNGRLWRAAFNPDGDSLTVKWIEIKEERQRR